jgi:hypothetical protein
LVAASPKPNAGIRPSISKHSNVLPKISMTLNDFQKMACKKFIKDKVGNPKNESVERLREWLFMKMNGQRLPEKYHPR